MKKIIFTLIMSSAILFGGVSCNVLDQYPHNGVSRDNLSEDDLALLYTGLYCYSQYKPSFEGYFQNDMAGGDFTRGGGSSFATPELWIRDAILPTSGWSTVPWQGYYAWLYQVNEFITAAQPKDNDPDIREMLGGAYFFRGLIYYNLVSKYRNVQILRKATNEPIANSSEAEGWAFVEENLRMAIERCPNFTNKNYVSVQAAKALMARTYLAQGKHVEAAGLAVQLIEDPVFELADFDLIFRGQENKEEIFTFINDKEESGINFASQFYQPATTYAIYGTPNASQWCSSQLRPRFHTGSAVADPDPFLIALAAHTGTHDLALLRYHTDGFQQVGHIAADDDRGEPVVGELAVDDLDGILGHALDGPVFGVLHAVVAFADIVAVVDGGDHLLQGVGARLDKGIGHPGVGLPTGGLSSAVAGGGGAQLQGGAQVGDARHQDAVFDDLGIAGKHALVVEEIAACAQCRSRTVLHIDDGGGHVFAHIFLGQGPVLDEHIHLYAMAEGLMADQAGHMGVGDDVVLSGDHGLCSGQHMGGMQDLVHDTGKLLHHEGEGRFVLAGAELHRLVVFTVDHTDHAVDPGVVLVQLPIWGDEQLAGLHGVEADTDIAQVFAFGADIVPELPAVVQEAFLGMGIQIAGPGEGLHQGLVGKVMDADGLGLQPGAEAEALLDFCHLSIQVAVDIVKGIFVENAVPGGLDHKAALGIHAGGDIGQLAADGIGPGLHIHAQDADIVVALLQLCHQGLCISPAGLQEIGK